jgi:ParB/Sulfiredoxin domain
MGVFHKNIKGETMNTETVQNRQGAAYFWKKVLKEDREALKETISEMSAKEFKRVEKILGLTSADKDEALDSWIGEMSKEEEVKEQKAPEGTPKKGRAPKAATVDAEAPKKGKAPKAKKEKTKKEKTKKEKAPKEPKPKKEKAPKAPKPKAGKASAFTADTFPICKGIQLGFDNEYFAMVPRPSRSDYQALKLDIEANGLYEPIKVVEKGGRRVIFDGYTRYQVLAELEREITENDFIVIDIDPDIVADRILSENVTRRHLTDAQKISIWKQYKPTMLEEIDEHIRKERDRKKRDALKDRPRGEEKPDTPKKEDKPVVSARAIKAKEMGVSEAELKYYDYLEKWAPEALAEEVAKGKDGKLYPLYQSTVEMEQFVKKHDLGAWNALKENPSLLKETYDELVEAFGKEHKPGDIEKVIIELQGAYERVLIEEYGSLDMEKLNKFQTKFWQVLEGKKKYYAEIGK